MRTFALLLLAIGLTAGEPQLQDSGLPTGRSEDLLPTGAALHLRLGNLARSLDALDALLVQFVPEKALPPELQQLFTQPQPMLSLLGQQTIGMPLNPAAFATLFGVDLTRPVTLTIYPAQELGWIVCLPAADLQPMTGLLVNLLRARSFAPLRVGDRDGWAIEGSNPNLPQRMVVLCAKDAVYIASDPRLAEQLGAASPRLASDPLIAALPDSDITVALSTVPAKPLIAHFGKQFARLPPPLVEKMREQFLRGLGPDQIRGLNLQLRLYSNLQDIHEALNFGECMIASAVETFVPALTKTLLGTDGIALNCEFRPEGLGASMIVQAKGIEQLGARPIPLAELTKAISTLPGERLILSAKGRRPPAGSSDLRVDWAELAVRKLQERGVVSTFLPALVAYWRACERVPALEDNAPWVLSASTDPATVAPLGPGLAPWIAAFNARLPVPNLQVLPQQEGDTIAATFREMAAVENRNAARWTKVLESSLGDERWFDQTARFRSEARPGKATRLVYEDAWITRSGMFGYSQHELINRIIAYHVRRNGLELLQRVSGDRHCWLDDVPPAVKPMPPALAALLAQVPDGADALAIVRLLPAFADALDAAHQLENAARQDLDLYLAASVKAINDNQGKPEPEILAALQQVPMPTLVASLNINPETRNLYLVLPGGLRYPRPEIAPVLRRVLANVLAKSAELGGLVAWTRAEAGRMTLHVKQDLRGLALFTRSAGNAIWEEFLSTGEPLPRIRAVLGTPDDGTPNANDQVIFYNLLWPIER